MKWAFLRIVINASFIKKLNTNVTEFGAHRRKCLFKIKYKNVSAFGSVSRGVRPVGKPTDMVRLKTYDITYVFCQHKLYHFFTVSSYISLFQR